ncbi:hypothetical protein PO461_11970 [Enterobacter asburiae]|uniref:hypothetical protein n=1 Tax=Enterobacter asburiae TaxID=61645 RepID=UPI002FF955C9
MTREQINAAYGVYNPALPPLVHLQVESEFTGHVVLWMENGKVTQQMQIPDERSINKEDISE